MASISIIPASESGFSSLVTATPAASTHRHAARAHEAPTAGQKKRMSVHMSRTCAHIDSSRSVLMRVSTSDCTEVRLSSA